MTSRCTLRARTKFCTLQAQAIAGFSSCGEATCYPEILRISYNFVKDNYDAPCLTKITLDNWRCFGQVEVLSTAGVLSITGDVIDNWRYFGQLEVLWTTGDTVAVLTVTVHSSFFPTFDFFFLNMLLSALHSIC